MAAPRSKKKANLVPVDKPVMELVVKPDELKNNKKKTFRGDYRQTAILIKIGKEGALNAIRESKALGLEIIYMEKGVIFKEDANGIKVRISETLANRKKTQKKGWQIPKGTILHER